MPWAKIARVLELSRAPASVAVALACATGMVVGPCREIPQARIFVFGIGFTVALVAAVIVLTALLAVAEHAAENARRVVRIRVPTATAAYRTAPLPSTRFTRPSTRAAARAGAPPPRGTLREQA